jgi:hypothetical protein
LCLDLTTSSGVNWTRIAYQNLVEGNAAAGLDLPENSRDQLKRNLDCAVVRRLHTILDDQKLPAVDSLKGVFTEGPPAYPVPDSLKNSYTDCRAQSSMHQRCFRVPLDRIHR